MRSSLLALPFLAATPAQADCVVLLHGLARSENSLFLLQQVLEFHQYRVVNHTYPSEDAPIDDLVRYVGQAAAECGTDRLNFVTHSLGGILVRAWLGQQHPPNLGRVVMLAPPNHGSEIVDTLDENDLLRRVVTWFNGPVTRQLGTDADSVPNRLPPVDFDLGVIAGDVAVNPLNPIGVGMFDGPNYGTVSVASTRVEGMSDHILLPVTHTFMMNNPRVIAEAVHFIETGRFDPDISWIDSVFGTVEDPCPEDDCGDAAEGER